MLRVSVILTFFKLIVVLMNVNKVLSTNINNTDVITIATPGCTIPGFPLISESIHQLVGPPPNAPTCAASIPLIDSNATHIWVLKEVFVYYNIWDEKYFHCCYRNFSVERNLNNLYYGECKQFSSSIKVEHEFVRIECYNSDSKIYDDFLQFFHMNKHKLKSTYKGTEYFNVLLLGIESMSRMNFLRTMPKTAQYLRDRGSIQLLGYNKLGDNSFPNLVPFLTGESFRDVKEKCRRNNMIDTENCPFIWDDFKDAGFYTALGADSSAGLLGSLEFQLPTIPTDFYLQPFMYETRNIFKHKDYDYHICLHNKLLYKILLNYVKNVTQRAQNSKLFGIFWEESLSHEHLNYPHMMDEDYLDLLKTLEKNQFLHKTIVVLFGDHGMRFGKIAQTEQGRLEERLPLFDVLFPLKFRSKYKLAYKNFKNNSYRLTTPYDVYKTLLDLNNPSSLDKYQIEERTNLYPMNSNKISLFLPIPENRTCASIGINEHWCTCRKGVSVPAGRRVKMISATYIIEHINSILHSFPQCHQLKLEQILDASVTKHIHDEGRTYRVVIKTSPGEGLYDGTLIREKGVFAIAGTVSRLNVYRNQSQCIDDVVAKMYCYCK